MLSKLPIFPGAPKVGDYEITIPIYEKVEKTLYESSDTGVGDSLQPGSDEKQGTPDASVDSHPTKQLVEQMSDSHQGELNDDESNCRCAKRTKKTYFFK